MKRFPYFANIRSDIATRLKIKCSFLFVVDIPKHNDVPLKNVVIAIKIDEVEFIEIPISYIVAI